jgi:hypothetical protein
MLPRGVEIEHKPAILYKASGGKVVTNAIINRNVTWGFKIMYMK